MIARIWHGRVKEADYQAYTDFMKARAIPDYQQTAGFVKLSFLRRLENGIGHFTLITYWENMAVIENFAGAEVDKAKYYPEDSQYLLEFEEKVLHFEVFG